MRTSMLPIGGSGGSGGNATILEGVVLTKYGSGVYTFNYNDSVSIVQDSWTGNYIQHTYNSNIVALQNCRVAVKKGTDTITVADYAAGDTIVSYQAGALRNGISVQVLG